MSKTSSKSSFLIFLTAFTLFAMTSFADQPKFKNKSLTFKPLSMAEQTRLLPQKLGTPPVFTAKEQKKIDNGKVIVRELSGSSKIKTIEAYGTIDAPCAKVMSFLKDYKARVGIFPHVEDVKIQWEGNIAHVELQLSIAFKTINYKMNYRHYKNSFIEWEYVEGDIKNSTGHYKLFPIENGSKTLMVYHVISETGMAIPKFIEKMLTKSSMPKVIKAVRQGVRQLK